jgi:signal transduction histidine kinase
VKLLPRSLFSRLVLVLFVVLLVAQIGGFALHMHERGELLAQASGMRSAQRIADVVQLIDPMSPAQRKTIEKVLSAPPLVLSLARAPLPAPAADADMRMRAGMFGSLLRRQLPPSYDIRVDVMRAAWPPGKGMGIGMGYGRMHAAQADGMPHWRMHAGEGPGYTFVAQVKLHDGTLATFDTSVPQATANWPYRLLASAALLLAAVLLVSWIAVRWATRPLKTLAAAAEELGRNIQRPPMPESGPVEVAQAARAFNTMQSRLAGTIRERTQVLAAMSHDLKTPISRLRLRAELLDDAQQRAKFTADLQEMEAMVAGALDFLRGMENGEPPRPVDMMALLESLQTDMQESGGEVRITGRTTAPLHGRVQALKRGIGNLIENAIKYGQRADVVIDDNETRLRLRIEDDGPGIPADQLEKVFEPFYRLESSRNRDTGGSGLGLAIARGVAALHGGQLTLENRAQGGLAAILTLPRR